MKKNEIKVGGRYMSKVSDKLTVVRIDRENPHGGWDATNEKTGKPVRIKSAQRLRSAVRDHARETAEVLSHGRQAAGTATAAAPEATGATTLAPGAARAGEAAKDTKAAKKSARAAKGAAKGGKKEGMSGLDAAAKVLAEAGAPMNCKAMVDAMLAKGYWKTDGKTPAATLYSAIIREVAAKGKDARFCKVERGQFELVPTRQ
jgi:hypothetical protein